MKYITLILVATTVVYAQEFGIQGNLSVSGLILNSTIDSLQTEIQELSAQIDSLEANSSDVKTKLYEVFLPTFTSFHSLAEITGETADWYLFQVVAKSTSLPLMVRVYGLNGGMTAMRSTEYYYSDEPTQQVIQDPEIEVVYHNGGEDPLNESILIMVTTPISD